MNDIESCWLLSEDEYFEFDAHSFSQLKEIVPPKTPYHYWLSRRIKRKPTAAMVEGTMTHTVILEPERFEEQYVFFDHNYKSLSSGDGSKALRAFKENHRDKTVIHDRNLWYSLLRRRKNAYHNRTVRELLTNPNAIVESGMTWLNPSTGLRMKGKPDHYLPQVMLDVKTMQDISSYELAKTIAQRLYFMQAAIYIDGVREVSGFEIDRYFILAIEKFSDLIRLVELSPTDIETGRKLYHQALMLAEQCKEQQRYYGYEDEIVPIELPAYYMDNYETIEF
jgi:hypothetical protein